MKVEPYLFFNGRCDEAIEFYKKTVGAKVTNLFRYKDSPEPPQPGHSLPPNWGEKVMHSNLVIGTTMMMASDGDQAGKTNFSGFQLSLVAGDEVEAKKVFAALGEGGQVRVPMTKTFFSPAFGMLEDKFGIGWMVMADVQAKN